MKIGELGKGTGTKPETIRFYEKAGLLPAPKRTASNYRSYGDEHVLRLACIRGARALGFTLDDVRSLLSLLDEPPPADAATREVQKHLTEVLKKQAALNSLKLALENYIDGTPQMAGRPILEALAGYALSLPEGAGG